MKSIVGRIHLVGLEKTNEAFVQEFVENIQTATSLQDLKDQIESSVERLESLGIFQSISATLDLEEDPYQL